MSAHTSRKQLSLPPSPLALALGVAVAAATMVRGGRRKAERGVATAEITERSNHEPVRRSPRELPQRLVPAAASAGGDFAVDLPLPLARVPRRFGSAAAALAQAWLARVKHELIALTVVAIPVVAAHAWGMGRYPAFFDDEGTYVSQAYAVDKLHALAPYTYWYDHPPFGWILLGAWSKLFPVFAPHTYSIAAARGFMLFVTAVSTVLLYCVARRLGIRPVLSGFAVLLFGLSPLAIEYQRMVLLDNIAVMWLLAAFFLALTPRGKLLSYAASALCFAAACLTKETFLLFLPALILTLWIFCPRSTRAFAISIFATLFVCSAAFYALFAALRGELLEGAHHTSLMYGIKFQLLGRKGSGTIFSSDSAAHGLVTDWLHIDPVVLGFGVPLIPLLLFVRRFRTLGLALAIPVAMVLRPGGYVPAMYIIGIIPFAALAVAAAAETFVAAASRSHIRFANIRRVAAGVCAAALVLAPTALAAPRWVAADKAMFTTNDVSANERAVRWLEAHASRKSTLLVDDTIWTDLVQNGFDRARTVWFYKLDLDPAVRRPWWKFDYVVRSNLLGGNLHWLPRSEEVFNHSRPVVAFTTPHERIEIRRVIPPRQMRRN
jgi:hypothetical protein